MTDPESLARTLVLRRLTASARPRADLRAHLLGRGIPEEVVESVLDRFAETGLVDDLEYAREYARTQLSYHGQSKQAIAYKLRQRGVTPEHIDAALSDVGRDAEVRAACELLRRRSGRWADLEPRQRRERQLAMLARRGYSMSLALEAVGRAGSD